MQQTSIEPSPAIQATAAAATRPVAVTGIKASGRAHLDNFLGMIRPALALAASHDACYSIADAHALTTLRDSAALRRHTREIAATWLALGLDPRRMTLYRQSDLPEVFQLAWVLACYSGKGLLNRAHAYKAAVAANRAAGRPDDHGVNAGLFGSPVLMAADILLLAADVVPVGLDQRQHVETAREVAASFNAVHGPALRLPDPLIDRRIATIPGLDGRKMSKSYGNVVPIFAAPGELRALVGRIVTDSRAAHEPKDPERCTLFALYRQLAQPAAVAALRARYLEGGVGYREVKEELAGLLEAAFGPARVAYRALMDDPAEIERVLAAGAERARERAAPVLDRVRAAVGLGPAGRASAQAVD
ncbi:MAG TPA: tryptophan--tRNA ligase [Actinomycetes bacterium]|jgi:tryptophanyl-tRNA synthetase|nr:tryptophan--tRNA ligase [Actinomycetes bacterium]